MLDVTLTRTAVAVTAKADNIQTRQGLLKTIIYGQCAPLTSGIQRLASVGQSCAGLILQRRLQALILPDHLTINASRSTVSANHSDHQGYYILLDWVVITRKAKMCDRKEVPAESQ